MRGAEHQRPVAQDHAAAWSGTSARSSLVLVIVVGGVDGGGSARSRGCQAARAKRNDNLLGGVVGVRPNDGEDGVWCVVVVVFCCCKCVVCGVYKGLGGVVVVVVVISSTYSP